MTRRTVWMAMVVCIVPLAWTSLRAQPVDTQPEPDFARAAELYRTANAALDQGRFDDAARDYTAAFEITKDPVLLFKIGSVNEKAGNCGAALGFYDRYLTEAKPRPEFVALTHERIKACGGTPRAQLDVTAAVEAGAGAEPELAPELAPEIDEPEEDFPTRPELARNFVGSVQLNYMAVPSRSTGREISLDGATAEASLKLAMDFKGGISANVKVCVACHGFEVGMAFFDMRVADQLNVRVGRFTPAFGEFPLRHDPANHRTSDKPLPYDMGRMLRINEWNQGVLPAPWVDNGVEVNGTHFFGNHVQVDYAVHAVGGPRAGSDPVDFDFKMSRSGESYYIDNNSRPSVGGQLVMSLIAGSTTLALGASMMRGTYDPQHRLPFSIWGAHAVLRLKDIFVRAEYLSRRTKMSLGSDPEARFKYGPGADGLFDPYFVKDGGYLEIEAPAGRRVVFVFREDGMRRRGNVVATSALRKDSMVLRHTAGIAVALQGSLRLKLSYEYYDFSDFEDESVVHVGIAGPF